MLIAKNLPNFVESAKIQEHPLDDWYELIVYSKHRNSGIGLSNPNAGRFYQIYKTIKGCKVAFGKRYGKTDWVEKNN